LILFNDLYEIHQSRSLPAFDDHNCAALESGLSARGPRSDLPHGLDDAQKAHVRGLHTIAEFGAPRSEAAHCVISNPLRGIEHTIQRAGKRSILSHAATPLSPSEQRIAPYLFALLWHKLGR